MLSEGPLSLSPASQAPTGAPRRLRPVLPTPSTLRHAFARTVAHPVVVGLLIFVTVLSGYLLSYNIDKPTHNADGYLRYQAACHIVEDSGFSLKPYRPDGRTGRGVGGLSYTQYTLGQSTAIIPFYLLGRALSGVAHPNCDATIAPTIVYLTVKALNMVLGALLCVLFFATARLLAYRRPIALALTLTLAFGTSLWPDVQTTEEHTMESLFLLAGAYAALRYSLQRRKTWLWVLIMGLAAGLIFVTRVAGMIGPPIFAVYLLVLHRHLKPGAWTRPFVRDLGVFALGVAPSLVINATFDALRFGKFWQTGPTPDDSFGYPPWFGIPNLLISPGKGLLWYTPALFLLVLAVRPFWRSHPLPSRLFLIICLAYLLFYANVNYWHGDPSWGPRYLFALLPYLILPLGEVWKRWGSYRNVLRAGVVGVLAASFLVQFSATTVSYWRHWHFIYGDHYDQVEDHAWGQNLNYWWQIDQSPILISLQGVAEITQKYVDGEALLAHPEAQRLANPIETCIFPVFRQASICLTDLDDLRNDVNWNTFTLWWLHTYSWWNADEVSRVATWVLTIFLLGGGLLVGAVHVSAPSGRRRASARRAPPLTASAGANGNGASANGRNGHGPDLSALNGTDSGAAPATHGVPPEIAALPILTVAAATPSAGETVPAPGGDGPAPRRTRGHIAALAPLGAAVLIAMLVYGGIVNAAALAAPRTPPPLFYQYPQGTTVRDGAWTYSVVDYRTLPVLPTLLIPKPDIAHHYVALHLRLHNLLDRPQHVRLEFFRLTDPNGLEIPWILSPYPRVLQLAQLYHLTPLGTDVSAHGAIDGVLLFLVRNSQTHLRLLGPGIALVNLYDDPSLSRRFAPRGRPALSAR